MNHEQRNPQSKEKIMTAKWVSCMFISFLIASTIASIAIRVGLSMALSNAIPG